MSGENSGKGGFHFGNVGGNVNIDAGGDVVGGDKTTTTTTTTTTTITHGFKEPEDKADFIRQIEALRKNMREMKSHIESLENFDEDERDELVLEIMNRIKGLKTVKEKADDVPAGEEAAEDVVKVFGDYLDKTSTFMEKLQAVGKKTAEFGERVTPIIKSALPVLLSARHLFGLP